MPRTRLAMHKSLAPIPGPYSSNGTQFTGRESKNCKALNARSGQASTMRFPQVPCERVHWTIVLIAPLVTSD